MIKEIKKKNIKGLLKIASKEWDVYVPQKDEGENVWMKLLPENTKQIDDALKNIVLENVDTVIPPKNIFYPQLDSLFKFKKGKIQETIKSSPKLLFGVTPCDLRGILFCDEFFKRNFEDTYYLSKAQNRLIVVKACLEPPRSTCFCTSTGTGPFAETGYDLQIVERGNKYIVEIGSKKGQSFVNKYKRFFEDIPETAVKVIEGVRLKAIQSVELKVNFEKALKLMANDEFTPRYVYEQIGERCIYCGGCVYVCPTCTCFNVSDDGNVEDGIRYRTWDTCVFEGYTREASGHNPRAEKWLRTSRRYEHKLKYDYAKTGTSGCVGCGRCLASCPVNLGMSKFIQRITASREVHPEIEMLLDEM